MRFGSAHPGGSKNAVWPLNRQIFLVLRLITTGRALSFSAKLLQMESKGMPIRTDFIGGGRRYIKGSVGMASCDAE
jgi:hypothetical protein